MDTNQIYSIVNTINSQTMGSSIVVTDTASLVALGDTVLSSATNTESFLNSLTQLIAKTIVSYRPYSSKFTGLYKTDFEWGAIIRKVKVSMPDAIESDVYNLEDGESIDQQIVSKPKAKQKLFVKRTPYSFPITIQEITLKEAFKDAESLSDFIQAIFGEIRNKIELTLENLARLCLANFMANVKDAQTIHLITEYAEKTGTTALTPAKALLDEGFLRYAIGRMNYMSERLTEMSTLYNGEGETRHTPLDRQYYITNLTFDTQMATQVQYAAFHENYVSKVSNMTVGYWQSGNKGDEMKIDVNIINGEDTTQVQLDNIVACIFDKDALGTYRQSSRTRTAPYNARGEYVNTFFHEDQLWFNDFSENFIMFMLD